MKRTNKVISIILSVLMLMQMMTGIVFAANKTKFSTPTSVRLVYDDSYEEYVYKVKPTPSYKFAQFLI